MFINYSIYIIAIYIAIKQLIPILYGKSSSQNFAGLQAALFFFFLSTEISRPFFPIFVKSFTVPFLSESMKMAIPQIIWGASAMVFTSLGLVFAKKMGNKLTLLSSSFGLILSLIALALIHNYWIMLVARSLMAICYATVTIISIIHLAKHASAKVLGVFLSALAAASICANVLGGTLSDLMTYQSVFFICIAFALLSLLLFLQFFVDDVNFNVKKTSSDNSYLKNMKLHIFSVCANMPYRIVITGFILYLLPINLNDAKFSNLLIGQLLTIYFFVNWITVNPIALFLDKYKIYKSSFILSLFLIAIPLFIFPFYLENVYALYLLIAILSLGMNLNTSIQIPIIPIVFTKECEQYGKDIIISYFKTVERIGSVIGPIICAFLLHSYHQKSSIAIGFIVIFLALALILFFIFNKKNQHR